MLLDELAEAEMTTNGSIPALVEGVRRRAEGGLVIAVLGSLSVTEAESLVALRASGTTCIALAIDAATWLNLSEPERTQTNANHEAACLALLRAGWRVIPVGHGAKLHALWPAAAIRGSQGFALRAAMAETVAPTQARRS
jgi:hypothetical protein